MVKQTDEAYVKASLKAFFTEHGVYFFMPMTHGYGRSGIPDIIACAQGTFWGVECKGQPSNQTTALQRMELRSIYQAHGNVAVVDRTSLEAFKSDFLAWLRGAQTPQAHAQDWRRDADRA